MTLKTIIINKTEQARHTRIRSGKPYFAGKGIEHESELKKKLEELEKEHDELIRKRVPKEQLEDIVKRKDKVAKQLYPVIISIREHRDMYGRLNGKNYGNIDFSKANNGWFDSTIFHKEIYNPSFGRTGSYPNDLGKKIGVYVTENTGSAHLRFIPTNENIKEVSDALKRAGYKVEIKEKKEDNE